MIYFLVAAFSFWFVQVTKLPKSLMEWLCYKGWIYKIYEDDNLKMRYPRRIKPFDCEICLSFWLCLSLTYSPTVNWVLMAGLTSLLTFLISLSVTKFLR